MKNNKLAESGEGLDIESRFQLQDQPSRISIVSRQSNTDMKGEDLVKYHNRTVRESEHEESPDRQSDIVNVINTPVEEELKQMEMEQSKTATEENSLSRPET